MTRLPVLNSVAFTFFACNCSLFSSASYENATAEVQRWKTDNLPLDVWALDMNWRLTDNKQDRSYDHPNTQLFPNYTQWFDFVAAAGLRTYFNGASFVDCEC
jgi:hypothetical protein